LGVTSGAGTTYSQEKTCIFPVVIALPVLIIHFNIFKLLSHTKYTLSFIPYTSSQKRICITLMSLFYLTNFYFLSIEVDIVMETDNELEEKDELDKVRISIRN
jgi:hypothetical protein